MPRGAPEVIATRLEHPFGPLSNEAVTWANCNVQVHPLDDDKGTVQTERMFKPSLVERDAEIVRRRETGEALEAIATTYGLTRQRVQQICKDAGLVARRVTVVTRTEASR